MLVRSALAAAAWLVVGAGASVPVTSPTSVVTAAVTAKPTQHAQDAGTVGGEVLKSFLAGHSIAGVVVRQSSPTIWLHPLFSHHGVRRLTLSDNAVIWQGGWRFVGQVDLRHVPVNLVIVHNQVLGILAYHAAYGRVVRRRGRWVTIRRVHGKLGSNPACRTAVGRQFHARINAGTVWNSARYVLPRKSLVQYTVYGVPGYPYMLGGVEDYGPAPCRSHSSHPHKPA